MNKSNVIVFMTKSPRCDTKQTLSLSSARNLLGMSQECLAKTLGWTIEYIQDMESDVIVVDKQTELSVECLLRRENKWHTFNQCA